MENQKRTYLNSDKIMDFVNSLNYGEIFSTTFFSKNIDVSIEESRKILIELVENNLLDFAIIVSCKNDKKHCISFKSIKDLNKFINKNVGCSNCGYEMDFDTSNIKVGFMRKDVNKIK